jgi:regulation of enolase protein 1 (concanavalin A-like superfamily)
MMRVRTERYWSVLLLLAACWLTADRQAAAGVVFRDDFNSPELESGWTIIREDPNAYSLTDRPGFLRIRTQEGAVGENSTVKNLFLRPVTGDFIIETRLEFDPREPRQFAGLLIHASDAQGVALGLAFAAGERGTFRGVAMISTTGADQPPEQSGAFYDENNQAAPNIVYLRMLRSGNQVATAFSPDGITYTELGSMINPLPVTVNVGMAAGNGDAEACGQFCDIPKPADFNFFQISSLDGTDPTPGNGGDNEEPPPPPPPTVFQTLAIQGPGSVIGGNASTYKAIATFSDASSADVTGQVQWLVAPSGLATISAGELSTFEVQSPQQVTVVASYTPPGGDAFNAAQLVQITTVPSGSPPFFGLCGSGWGLAAVMCSFFWIGYWCGPVRR